MLNISFDLSGIMGLEKLEETLQKAAEQEAANLAMMVNAKMCELASQRLHTRRETFLEALRPPRLVDGVWLLELGGEAMWIENGLPRGSMLPGLLASPKAKRARDGSAYVIVPFDSGPGHGPTNSAPAQLDLVNAVRAEMKKQKIPWAKIERNQDGSPKLGRLHNLSVTTPDKTHQGPGQGWGPVNQPRQGPNDRQKVGGGPGGGGTPFLQGASVSQRLGEGGKVQRSVTTFRVASSKHMDQGRWIHPGLPPASIWLDACEWALKAAEEEILPRLIETVKGL